MHIFDNTHHIKESLLMSGFYQQLQNATESERAALLSVPIIQSALQGSLTRAQYVAFLTQAYHHVRHTVPLLMACGSRLGPQHITLQRAIAEYIEEEIGHDEWILNDIRACGVDAEPVRHGIPHHETEMMVAYAYHQIDRGNPIGFFGMVHVLEGTSVSVATQAAQVIQQTLNLPTDAFSYLLSHGSLDQEHVLFFENLMNTITSEEDQRVILHCARRFYRLYGDVFRSLL
jgi:pyrroloquinoline quinone (PQQ) biosynthesis protein C